MQIISKNLKKYPELFGSSGFFYYLCIVNNQLKINVMKATKNRRLKIYKLILKSAIEDRKNSIKYDSKLFGLCFQLSRVVEKLKNNYSNQISDYPELWALKPKNKNSNDLWWSTNMNNRTRINKLKEVIRKMESE